MESRQIEELAEHLRALELGQYYGFEEYGFPGWLANGCDLTQGTEPLAIQPSPFSPRDKPGLGYGQKPGIDPRRVSSSKNELREPGRTDQSNEPIGPSPDRQKPEEQG